MSYTSGDPITYTELTFPDITGKTIGAYALVTFSGGAYITGGIPANLMKFADVRTVDFNGFLQAEFYFEAPIAPGGVPYQLYYSPVTDTLQIFNGVGVELTAGTLPAAIVAQTTLLHATWDRTSTRG